MKSKVTDYAALTLIKWNLPVDYLDSYSLFITKVLVRLTQLPLEDMLIHD